MDRKYANGPGSEYRNNLKKKIETSFPMIEERKMNDFETYTFNYQDQKFMSDKNLKIEFSKDVEDSVNKLIQKYPLQIITSIFQAPHFGFKCEPKFQNPKLILKNGGFSGGSYGGSLKETFDYVGGDKFGEEIQMLHKKINLSSREAIEERYFQVLIGEKLFHLKKNNEKTYEISYFLNYFENDTLTPRLSSASAIVENKKN